MEYQEYPLQVFLDKSILSKIIAYILLLSADAICIISFINKSLLHYLRLRSDYFIFFVTN